MLARFRLWLWKRNYDRLGRYKKPRKLYAVRKVLYGKEYGWWLGCYKYNGYAFTKNKRKAYLFCRKELAETTANNSNLDRVCEYRVVRYKR